MKGTLQLEAKRRIGIKTVAFRLHSGVDSSDSAALIPGIAGKRALILDRTLAVGERLELPIALPIPSKLLANAPTLWVDIDTHPRRRHTEWRGKVPLPATR